MNSFSCQLCPRRCKAVRTAETGSGACGSPALPKAARAALHTGEEPCISGSRGSGTIFFSGCPLHCVFCQNRSISQEGFGETITTDRLADIFRELEALGAHNINLVSPTPFVPVILQALERYRPAIPIVYNTGGYELPETLRMLDGAVDIYLPDCKYADAALGARLSGVADYPQRAREAILEMARQTGPMQLDENGIATRGTMVRHLVLPGHTNDSLSVLGWLAENLPQGVWVSLLFQYTPLDPPETFPELRRRLTRRECEKVWDRLLALGLTDGYVQDRTSATAAYIPAFDLTGIRAEP